MNYSYSAYINGKTQNNYGYFEELGKATSVFIKTRSVKVVLCCL